MYEALPLLIAALAFRAGGAMVRGREHSVPLRVGGWLMCGAGVWVAAGAFGAWFPLWPVVCVALAAGAVDVASGARWRRGIMPAADASIALMSALLSVPALSIHATIVLVAAVIIVGLALDQAPQLLGRPARVIGFAAPAAVAIALGAAIHYRIGDSEVDAWYRHAPLTSFANIGLSRPVPGQRIELRGDTAAWLLEPTEPGPYPGAVVLHGAHRLGSQQGAACVLRRALRDAGFVVISIDHPGYGQTPPPSEPHSVEAWDALPAAVSAIEMLKARGDVHGIVVIGHSMGTATAAQLLAEGNRVDQVILFGAAASGEESPRAEAYWHRRFHTDRGLTAELDPDLVRQIRRRYSASRFLTALDEDHAPIVLVNFGIEHPNIVRDRDSLYEAIPGPKRSVHLAGVTHYFNALSNAELMLMGDARTTRELAAWLSTEADALRDRPHALAQREAPAP